MEFSGPAVFAVARSPSKMKRVDYMITSNFWFVSTSQHIWNFSLSYRFKSKYLDVHPISCHDFSASILKSHQFQLHPLHPGKTVSNLNPQSRFFAAWKIFPFLTPQTSHSMHSNQSFARQEATDTCLETRSQCDGCFQVYHRVPRTILDAESEMRKAIE